MPMKLLAKLTDLPETSQHILDDFDRRYTGTYLKYGKIPIYINGKNREGAFVATKENGDTLLFTVNTTNEDVEILLPPVGYYNVNGTPLFIIKNPQRQWKRSFCKNIYKICTAMNTLPNRIERYDWYGIAKAMINPVYAHLDQISNELFCNVAINRNLCLVSKDNLKVIAYKRYPIAVLDFNNRTVTCKEPSLRQELIDLFYHTGVKTWKLC